MQVDVELESTLARQVLLVDGIAQRYGCLPSSVMNQADTFDIFIINTAMGLQQKMDEQANKTDGDRPPVPDLTEEQMLAMMAKARSKDGNSEKRDNKKP